MLNKKIQLVETGSINVKDYFKDKAPYVDDNIMIQDMFPDSSGLLVALTRRAKNHNDEDGCGTKVYDSKILLVRGNNVEKSFYFDRRCIENIVAARNHIYAIDYDHLTNHDVLLTIDKQGNGIESHLGKGIQTLYTDGNNIFGHPSDRACVYEIIDGKLHTRLKSSSYPENWLRGSMSKNGKLYFTDYISYDVTIIDKDKIKRIKLKGFLKKNDYKVKDYTRQVIAKDKGATAIIDHSVLVHLDKHDNPKPLEFSEFEIRDAGYSGNILISNTSNNDIRALDKKGKSVSRITLDALIMDLRVFEQKVYVKTADGKIRFLELK